MSGWEAVYYAVSAAAAAASAVSTVNASRTQSNYMKAQAQAADYNAEIAAQNADVARRNAAAREDAQRREGDAKNAKLRAAIAQSGFDPGTGSMGLVQEQSADNAELDALMIRYAGNLEGRGFDAQRVLDRYTGAAQRVNAAGTASAGYVGAAAGLLSQGSTYARGLTAPRGK